MNNVYNEPKYDTDVANKGYVDKIAGGLENNINNGPNSKTKNFAVQPYPPYRVGDTWTSTNGVYVCVNERLIGNYVVTDWELAKTYNNTKSVLDGGITTNGTIVVARGGTVAAGLTAYSSGDDEVRIWAGTTLENRDIAPFRVTQAGALTSTSGTIGGFTIGTTSLSGTTDKGTMRIERGSLASIDFPANGGRLMLASTALNGVALTTAKYLTISDEYSDVSTGDSNASIALKATHGNLRLYTTESLTISITKDLVLDTHTGLSTTINYKDDNNVNKYLVFYKGILIGYN